MKSICVFCGSSKGRRDAYSAAAEETGRLIGAAGLRLVYGGSKVGLMRIVADACLAAGGEVFGVIPQAMMEREIAHDGLTELHVVGTMHERKAIMADLSDAFVALPGGLGTLEELFEVYTWGQLGYHSKPYGLLNVAAYFDPLIAFLDHAVIEGFVKGDHRECLQVAATPAELLGLLADYEPKFVWKITDPDTR